MLVNLLFITSLFSNFVFQFNSGGIHKVQQTLEDHAIFIALIDIEQDEDLGLQIRVKTFTNDLEDAIYNHSGQRIQLIGKNNGMEYQKSLNEYFQKFLECSINNQKVNFTLESTQEENDTFWLHFNSDFKGEINKLKVKGEFFMELFPTQSNIVRININDKKFFDRLSLSEKQKEFFIN